MHVIKYFEKASTDGPQVNISPQLGNISYKWGYNAFKYNFVVDNLLLYFVNLKTTQSELIRIEPSYGLVLSTTNTQELDKPCK